MDLGKAIKEQKKLKNMSQLELSSISQTYLSQLENNLKKPTLDTLIEICEELDISILRLLLNSIDENDIQDMASWKFIRDLVASILK